MTGFFLRHPRLATLVLMAAWVAGLVGLMALFTGDPGWGALLLAAAYGMWVPIRAEVTGEIRPYGRR